MPFKYGIQKRIFVSMIKLNFLGIELENRHGKSTSVINIVRIFFEAMSYFLHKVTLYSE
jgi:hypothetical protein